jgi:small subunit ribosomal protein S3
LEELSKKRVRIDVQEVERPELDAYLLSENIASQLERRISHSRAMKRAVTQAIRMGAEGVKIICSGRLSGAEMARREWVMEGRVPRNTLRANIDYGFSEALTTYGRIGIKVWIYKGEVLPEIAEAAEAAAS